MSLYPQKTDNRNVPEDVFLIAEIEQGEITTYYIDLEGCCWQVDSWMLDKPRPAFPFQLCRLTGDTWKMIQARYDSWKRQREEGEG